MPSLPSQNTVSSTLTAQKLINYARLFPWTKPAVGLAGYSDEPAVSFLDDIVKKILAKSNPWKWNAVKVPVFQTQPYQQDYPTNVSQNDMGWLQAGIIVDINNNSQPIPKIPITVVQSLFPTSSCDRPAKLSWITNSLAETGQWPGSGTSYTDPLIVNGGGPSNNPFTAITDPNGNIQTIFAYGVTGDSQPNWPGANAVAGTQTPDGSVTWQVMDPNGVALRVDRLATFNSIVWEIRAIYQRKPPNITSLTKTIAPIPDDLSDLVKQGFLAYCYKQADSSKFPQEFAQWMAAIQEKLGASDREYQEFGFYPSQAIQGGGEDGSTGTSGYPGWPGWS